MNDARLPDERLDEPDGAHDIPPDVRRLIRRSIGSVESLDILLLLRAHAPRSLTTEQISADRRSSERSIAARLAQLRSQGLVRKTPEGFRYESDAERDETVTRLADVYRKRRTTIIRIMFEDR